MTVSSLLIILHLVCANVFTLAYPSARASPTSLTLQVLLIFHFLSSFTSKLTEELQKNLPMKVHLQPEHTRLSDGV